MLLGFAVSNDTVIRAESSEVGPMAEITHVLLRKLHKDIHFVTEIFSLKKGCVSFQLLPCFGFVSSQYCGKASDCCWCLYLS